MMLDVMLAKETSLSARITSQSKEDPAAMEKEVSARSLKEVMTSVFLSALNQARYSPS
jgi:exoribonuclease R